ncbi:TPA: sel1 repeat family protein [Pseudomonas aeruginosa]|uniref:Sel1 repeat family protein n=4 Tax=Pseudomonas TaxID=286 RepID=A0A3S4MMK4_PSEFL|nr:hypothetical protein F22031_09655 [Pseudomonas aeruginosa]EME94316.1 hypothetical protein H123_10012 [Pseudomonas aeruginosa PA21_ST175]ERF06307.1 hypothetical protein PA13_1016135 [Pseudomonas aeruginosa HB13]VEE48809.1 Uncharacterised protein [Pseudomonas fluorescens]ALY58059.1 hypothetical protein HW06_03040 [Pseudomonas aeruginosa]
MSDLYKPQTLKLYAQQAGSVRLTLDWFANKAFYPPRAGVHIKPLINGQKKDLGLAYTHCAASQGYAPASYELGAYYKIVEHNFPKALGYYQASVSQGGKSAALFISGVFDKASPDVDRMWYAPDEKLRKLYDGIYDKLAADPDLRFPNLIKDHPLPPHPTQGYDADRPDWKPGQ